MQCKVLNISKSAYYNWLNHHKAKLKKTAALLVKILGIYWDSHGIYGSPRITVILNNQGVKISQKKVAKFMKILGIVSIHTKNFPVKVSKITFKETLLIKNLIKNLTISHINQVWTTDITQINTVYDGSLYLISFIDQFSKRVVGWHLAKSQKTSDIIIALNNAIKKRSPQPGLIVHSDKGAVFRSKIYRTILLENHFIFSYTELNHSCDQNAAQESFHATIKKEWLSNKTLYHYQDTFKIIFDYIEGFYNTYRLHSSIGYLSPIDFENAHKNG